MRTLVVVPTYQEAGNIRKFLPLVRASVPQADVVVVDDNSPDGTADLVDKVAAELGQIEVLRRPLKEGLGAAYRAGFALGLDRGYDVIVQIDADLSHDPTVIPRLLEAVEGGADVAIGSRYVAGGSTPNWPFHRRTLSRYGNRYSAAMLRLPVHDATAGFRAYRADCLRRVEFHTTESNGYAFQTELAYRLSSLGGTAVEIPITFVDRTEGTSKMSVRIMVESMLRVTRWGVLLQAQRLRRRLARRSTS